MLLAELTVRHTRRHMPTRRVALAGAYLPTSGSAHGAALLSAVVATNLLAIDEEQRELLPRLLDDARRGLTIPRIALRHRLQHDVHGLDASRHRVLGEEGVGCIVSSPLAQGLLTDKYLHGVPEGSRASQAGSMSSEMLTEETLAKVRGLNESGVRFVAEATWNGLRPPLASTDAWTRGGPPDEEQWFGVAPDERWAMEVLGLRAGMRVERDDVNRRFRRMLRDAHPDSGGVATGAAARIAELTEARSILLAMTSDEVAAEG